VGVCPALPASVDRGALVTKVTQRAVACAPGTVPHPHRCTGNAIGNSGVQALCDCLMAGSNPALETLVLQSTGCSVARTRALGHPHVSGVEHLPDSRRPVHWTLWVACV
jgi:hypothetical protein